MSRLQGLFRSCRAFSRRSYLRLRRPRLSSFFVVFILLQWRDRFIGLIGSHDLHRTATALDDAAQRLSGYFLALTGVNASFGKGCAGRRA